MQPKAYRVQLVRACVFKLGLSQGLAGLKTQCHRAKNKGESRGPHKGGSVLHRAGDRYRDLSILAAFRKERQAGRLLLSESADGRFGLRNDEPTAAAGTQRLVASVGAWQPEQRLFY